jgi:hypothetical protein
VKLVAHTWQLNRLELEIGRCTTGVIEMGWGRMGLRGRMGGTCMRIGCAVGCVVGWGEVRCVSCGARCVGGWLGGVVGEDGTVGGGESMISQSSSSESRSKSSRAERGCRWGS